ncbi:ribosome maturation factor RimM [Polaromonas naphthalenivorans]|uniref:Ribosome maturation factor RimM n=1 Tax=Polaromonas naphthalenivorans (strain CJ2) TaxID=365044 RepID=RIMM_POLNA|nr:ribosome maturation factor RimM [Polaromonas naphthalenivorans]A1VM98.1 RecName: Full=Ribosome maturation factor RimM [Polaromonas naphthalenivorans CJ2]ABM36776.1 16S rRNA processing protein RimM [Polaromonas naphthalenivorans CJ2]
MRPGLQPSLGLTSSSLPDDALEVGRILDAWGVKGWVKILPHSTDPEALFSAKTWYLQTPDVKFRPGFSLFSGTVSLKVDEAKIHSGAVVAKFSGLDDRDAAEALRGARIFLSRSSFPAASADEYYWVDLIGLNVLNREGVALGCVRDLMATGPHSVLCVEYASTQEDGTSATAERMIPFVAAYVDKVDIAGKCITVDWQPDY